MPDFSSLIDKNFKVAGVVKPLRLTLREVKQEEVGQDKEILPVAYFVEDPRGLVLNSGRYKVIAGAHGSVNTDDWLGAVIELNVDPNVKYKGKVTGGLTVKVITIAPAKS